MTPFALSSPALTLSPPTPDDAARVAEYCTDPDFESLLTIPWPYTPAHAVTFVTDFVPRGWETGREVTWALREHADGPLIGLISLRFETIAAGMLGYWLGAPHRRRGHMSEAVRLVTEWAFGPQGGGLQQLRWECIVGNVASAALARSSGFGFTGTGPADVRARDGGRPESWHGVLDRLDSRDEKAGWPL